MSRARPATPGDSAGQRSSRAGDPPPPGPRTVWTRLLSPDLTPLRDAAAAIDAGDVAAVARLRRDYSADLVSAALDLAAARRKAAIKFPRRAAQLVADAQGMEQATSAVVAAHKAQRYLTHLGPGALVVDLCSGIGGDAMALRDAGMRIVAIDRDPLRAWMTGHNADCPTACADVARLGLRGAAVHLDPARRDARGRAFRLADYQPGPADIRDLLAHCPDAGVKLSPGVDFAELARHHLAGEIEMISEAGRLVQAMLWTGRLRRASRCATLLTDHRVHTLAGEPGEPPLGDMQRYLFTVDPSIERAELMGALCDRLQVSAVHPKLGLLTADHPIESPWLTGFELLAELPWRPRHPRAVRQWLGDHDAGIVEVKTRGKAVDPDQAQSLLRGRGDTAFTVFILRWDRRLVALVTRRMALS